MFSGTGKITTLGMNMKKSALMLVLLVLTGCTAMDKLAGMGVVSQQTSACDNSTVIDVSPNSLYDPNSAWGTPIQLGAIWSREGANKFLI